MVEAVCPSEPFAPIYHTLRRHNSQDNIKIHRRANIILVLWGHSTMHWNFLNINATHKCNIHTDMNPLGTVHT